MGKFLFIFSFLILFACTNGGVEGPQGGTDTSDSSIILGGGEDGGSDNTQGEDDGGDGDGGGSAGGLQGYKGPMVNLPSQPGNQSPAYQEAIQHYCETKRSFCMQKAQLQPYPNEFIQACEKDYQSCLSEPTCEAQNWACNQAGMSDCTNQYKECECNASKAGCLDKGGDPAFCESAYQSCMNE